MQTTYYLKRRLTTGEPSAVYRFFADRSRAPESYKKDDGWVSIPGLWSELMSGEIDDDDVISDSKAAEIIATWGGTL